MTHFPADAAAMLSDFGSPVSVDGRVVGRGVVSRVLVDGSDSSGLPVQRMERTLRVVAGSLPGAARGLVVQVGRERMTLRDRMTDPDDLDGAYEVWAVTA